MANKNNHQLVMDEIGSQQLAHVAKIREAITKKHKKVSNLTTPPFHIKKKMGMDYVEYSYMREVADK